MKKEIVFSTSQIARLFGVTSKAVADWVKNGLPKEGRGWFDPFRVADWLRKNRAEDDKSITEIRKRLLTIQAEMKNLDLEERRKELVPKGRAEAWCAAILEPFKIRLTHFPRRTTPLLQGKTDPNDVEAILRTEIQGVLNDVYAELKKPKPEPV